MGQFEREHISIQLKVPRGIMADIKPREAFAEVYEVFAYKMQHPDATVQELTANFPTGIKMINAMEARR